MKRDVMKELLEECLDIIRDDVSEVEDILKCIVEEL